MPKVLDFVNSSQPFTIRAKGTKKAEIVLYGTVGADWFGEGITAKKFSDELAKLDPAVNEIELRINSPGGDVFEGITIYNRLKQHKAKVTTYIDGLAASIASIIALAGDEVVMGEGALYMVHLPWTFTGGNRIELDGTVNRLMDVEEQMISIYTKKSGLSRSEVKLMLEKETWMDAEEAKEHGFVDSKMEDTVAIAASALKRATWLMKTPKNIKTDSDLAKARIEETKQKFQGTTARK